MGVRTRHRWLACRMARLPLPQGRVVMARLLFVLLVMAVTGCGTASARPATLAELVDPRPVGAVAFEVTP